jgi:hypothetical protein
VVEQDGQPDAKSVPLLVPSAGALAPVTSALKFRNIMRITSYIFIVIGLLGACFSFVALSGAALPYPDPTPEILGQQSNSIQFWGYSLLGSFLLIISGGWGLWRSRRKN